MSTLESVYREVRKPYVYPDGSRFVSPSRFAINVARNELALRDAEAQGFVSFDWSYDECYEPDGDYDLEEERRNLNSGTWEALQCVASGPKTFCVAHRHVVDEPEASLHGIVVPWDDEYQGMKSYRREIERELAHELGVI